MYFGLSEEQNQFQDYVKKFLSDDLKIKSEKKIKINYYQLQHVVELS